MIVSLLLSLAVSPVLAADSYYSEQDLEVLALIRTNTP